MLRAVSSPISQCAYQRHVRRECCCSRPWREERKNRRQDEHSSEFPEAGQQLREEERERDRHKESTLNRGRLSSFTRLVSCYTTSYPSSECLPGLAVSICMHACLHLWRWTMIQCYFATVNHVLVSWNVLKPVIIKSFVHTLHVKPCM